MNENRQRHGNPLLRTPTLLRNSTDRQSPIQYQAQPMQNIPLGDTFALNSNHRNSREPREKQSNHAYAVSKRFSYKDSQYSGADDENIDEYIAEYHAVCPDLSLSSSDCNKFVHKLFRDTALTFYTNEVLPASW